MANEIALKLGTFSLDTGTTYAISSFEINESKSVTTHNIPKTDGAIAEEAKRGPITISIKGTIGSTNYDALRTAIDALKAALQAGIQKLTLDDDRYIMAQLKSFKKSFITLRTVAEFSADFVAHYPFWLAETATEDSRTPTSGSGYVLANNGNAPARCKIEITPVSVTITDDIKIENQTNGKSFQYRGTLNGYDTLEVDNRCDTDDYEVLNDGADDIENFEGDFIELDPGNNTIIFTSAVASVVVITYKDCWY